MHVVESFEGCCNSCVLLLMLVCCAGAEELSIPGDYNQVMNGVSPW